MGTLTLFATDIIEDAKALAKRIQAMDLADRVETLNEVRQLLHAVSPFATEPVDCVLWVPADQVQANDYNPNSVAPPEMKLLRTSIMEDGYTQPVVGNREGDKIIVVDGFHRNRIGKEDREVRKRVHGYLPTVQIRSCQDGRPNRMASTIRHNRARGHHNVDGMSAIVAELAKRGWDDLKIGAELGMEPDEVLRLKQITGLAELFASRDFSEAWEGGFDGAASEEEPG